MIHDSPEIADHRKVIGTPRRFFPRTRVKQRLFSPAFKSQNMTTDQSKAGYL